MQQKVLVTDLSLVFPIENYFKEWARSKAIEKGIIISFVGIRKAFMLFKKVPDQTGYAIVLLTPTMWTDLVVSRKPRHASSFSLECTDFKNVIFENIH